jgi:quinol monooxygenase YgiN
MSSAIHILLKLVIAADQEPAWRSLMTEMVSSTETEPCTVLYEWYADAARGTWHIHERYADRDACDTHVDGFIARFGERFLGLTESVDVTVYGDPSAKVREILAGLRPTYFELMGGFARN